MNNHNSQTTILISVETGNRNFVNILLKEGIKFRSQNVNVGNQSFVDKKEIKANIIKSMTEKLLMLDK